MFRTTLKLVAAFLLIQAKLLRSQLRFIPADTQSQWWSRNFGSEDDPTVCPSQENPANGSVSVEDNTAVYECNDGYTLVGDNLLYCSCGSWSGSEPACRRNGEWGEWSPYSDCTTTCGDGSQTRTRKCDSPAPEEGGKDCPRSSAEARECSLGECSECPLIGNLTLGPLTVTAAKDRNNLQLACADGFDLIGPRSVPCTEIDLSTTTDLCLQSCPDLFPPQNGSVSLRKNGRIAKYQCNAGFTLTGSRARECVGGVWSGTDASCNEPVTIGRRGLQIGNPNNETVILLGIQPDISLPLGRFQIRAPEFLAVNCSIIVTFSYRTTVKTVDSISIKATLLSFNTNDVTGDDDQDLSVTAEREVIVTPTENETFVCLQLNCINATLLPAVSRVRLSLQISDGVFEFIGVQTNQRSSCKDNEEIPTTADCDNTTESGDCGYRNSGCGVTDWEVNLDETNPVVGLQSERISTSDDCDYHVCIPCLKDSGYTVSTESSTQVAKKRKRRTVSLGFVLVSKALCLPPPSTGFSLGIVVSSLIRHNPSNAYLSFDHSMVSGGLHQVIVYVKCDDSGFTSLVHLNDGFYFSIDHFNGAGKFGKRCLALHHYIEKSYAFSQGLCSTFRIAVEAVGVDTTVCVSNFKFLNANAVGGSFCSSVDNV